MGQKMNRAVAVSATLLLTLGVAACGDDDDDDDASSDTTVAGGEPVGGAGAFCDALVDFNTAVFQTDITPDLPEEEIVAAGESLAPAFDEVAAEAPDSLAEPAGEINAAVQALLDGDAEAFDSDELFETYTGFVTDAVGECDFETIEVTGVDYAFEGVEDSYQAGTVSFAFSNASEAEEHEMILIRRQDGVELSFEELLELPEEEAMELTEFKGAAFAPPGAEGGTLTELTPGDYAMICFIPVGGGEDGPPHFTEGMIHEFAVE